MQGQTAEQIADAVNAAGYRTNSKRFGARLFNVDTINAITRNEFYAAYEPGDERGTVLYKGERFRGLHPAATPRPAFLPVLRLLEGVVEYEEATGTLVTSRWRQRNRRASDYLQVYQRDRQTCWANPRHQSIWLFSYRYDTLRSRKEGTYGSTRNTENRACNCAGPDY